ncbi:hypothetical protein [Massilia sp. YIM B02443]|uniref:hypothetical protein n=1 Tax=Massilia sp. YIM B02443 TaxID=3050127 RepID=UPI0025B63386|nr:hypothetical protein [Massilia sp. YIM B02443]MDN4035484.1 hypothetical protein [Massilia sp. YIM B02443]
MHIAVIGQLQEKYVWLNDPVIYRRRLLFRRWQGRILTRRLGMDWYVDHVGADIVGGEPENYTSGMHPPRRIADGR